MKPRQVLGKCFEVYGQVNQINPRGGEKRLLFRSRAFMQKRFANFAKFNLYVKLNYGTDTSNGTQVDRKWIGSGLEVVKKWAGSGL